MIPERKDLLQKTDPQINCHLNFNELRGKSYEAPCTTQEKTQKRQLRCIDRSNRTIKEDAVHHAVVITFIISYFAFNAMTKMEMRDNKTIILTFFLPS